MTETSFPWADTLTGDASIAPYSHLEFSRFFGKIVASDAAGFVIPQYANNLTVQASSPVAATVDVTTGAAYVKGFFYENDTLATLTIAANASGNPRLDRIVLRVDFAAQTIRLAVLQGTAAASPSLPALTQIYGTTWEISLGYVWVANGFVTISGSDVHDERTFVRNAAGDFSGYLTQNRIINSEFMAFSGLSTIPSSVPAPPDGWQLVGTVTTWASATKPSVMTRGRYVRITAGAATSGMSQTLRVKPSTAYAIKLVHNVTAGDTATITVTTNSGAPATITRVTRRTATDVTELILYVTESDATTMTISLLGTANTDIVDFGQVLCMEGFTPGPFREFSEILFFDGRIGDTNWQADTKSTGTTTIDTDADFQTLILPGTRALYLYVQIQDSASAGGAASVTIPPTVGSTSGIFLVPLNGEPNNTFRTQSGWVKLTVNNQFDIVVAATGAGTLTATVRIFGIET